MEETSKKIVPIKIHGNATMKRYDQEVCTKPMFHIQKFKNLVE